ncbi:MAG: glycosyltransferase family 4 protein [Leptospirillia bacterium]
MNPLQEQGGSVGSRMRVAIISPTFPPNPCGGVSSSHYNLFLALRERGCTVRAFTFCDNNPSLFPDDPDVVRNGMSGPVQDFFFRLRMAYLKRRHFYKTGVQFRGAIRGATVGKRLASPLAEFRPDVVLVPDHDAPGAELRMPDGAKVVFASHHNAMRFTELPFFDPYTTSDARLTVDMEQRSVERSDAVVCPSEYMKDVFQQTYRFDGPVEVIPNLVDLAFLDGVETFDVRAAHGLPPEAPVVYIPSAGSAIKGERFVFEIVRSLARSVTGPIGFFLSGVLSKYHADDVRAVPANVRIIAPGTLPYAQNVAHMKACTLCVSPALLESFGMAQLEAAACGLPVVSFDTGGNREVVLTGQTGVLAPMLDVNALVDAGGALLADPEACRTMGAKARTHVMTAFSPDTLADRYLQLFERLRGG